MVKRILICGYPGSGKNWLGERLSKKSGIKFYDTDDLAWVKKFTVERDRDKKLKMLRDICKKDKWIIGTGGNYAQCAEKRAEIIILLKIGFLRSTYRILNRHRINKKLGKYESPMGMIKLAYSNILNQRPNSKYNKKFKEIKEKYAKKVIVLSQKEKRKFLEEYKR